MTKCLGSYQPLAISPDEVIGRLMKPCIRHPSSYLPPPRRHCPPFFFLDSFGVFSPVNLPPTRFFFLPLHLPPPAPPTRSSPGSSLPLTPPSLTLCISLLRSEHAPLCLARAHARACVSHTGAALRGSAKARPSRCGSRGAGSEADGCCCSCWVCLLGENEVMRAILQK